jgi:L-aminopeptidase/D-esterase-like protein
MRLEELPRIYGPETLSLMDTALEQAWRELKSRGNVTDAKSARSRLTTTIVALASVGETDSAKLKRFALEASRGFFRA